MPAPAAQPVTPAARRARVLRRPRDADDAGHPGDPTDCRPDGSGRPRQERSRYGRSARCMRAAPRTACPGHTTKTSMACTRCARMSRTFRPRRYAVRQGLQHRNMPTTLPAQTAAIYRREAELRSRFRSVHAPPPQPGKPPVAQTPPVSQQTRHWDGRCCARRGRTGSRPTAWRNTVVSAACLG